MWFLKNKAFLLRALSMATALQTVGGCLPPNGNVPPVEIRIRQIDGQVGFETILQDRILFFIPHPIRLRVSTLRVRYPQGEIIWMIHSSPADSHDAAQEIQYGIVPDGFRQMTPREGRPPDLKIDTEYEVEISWSVMRGNTTFVFKGPK